MSKKTLKNVGHYTFLGFVIIFLTLLISEASLWGLGISYPVFHDFDYERGRALKPGKKGWYRSEGEAYIRINKAGFRDSEHSLEKPKGTYRIAILGDSYAEARQVALEDTYWKKLERLLLSCDRFSPNHVEVLNFGVGGYGNTEELLTLRQIGWSYDPDLVLTTFFSANDVFDNFPPANPKWDGLPPRPFFHFEQGQLKLNVSFREWTPRLFKYRFLLWGAHNFRTLELLNQAMRVIESRQVHQNYDEHAFRETGLAEFVYAPPAAPVHHEAWAITDAVLTLTNKEVREHGAKYFLVTATSPNQLDPEQREIVKARLGVDTLDYPERRLRELGEKKGFPVFNLLYDFQEYADRHNVYLHGFPNTKLGAGHWNAKGHDLAAQLIAKQICENSSLP